VFGVYLFCAILGGGMVLFSLLGGGDSEVEVEVGEDLDFDGGGDAPHGGVGHLLLGFFKLRNLTFLLAAFGITGLLGTWLQVGPAATALLAAALGLTAMFLVHFVFQWLHRTDSAMDVLSDTDLEGTFARVVVPLARGTRGRISCIASGQQLYLTARLAESAAEAVGVGTAVVILRMNAGVAEVAPAPSLELSSSTD
jgi:hypothetical protein